MKYREKLGYIVLGGMVMLVGILASGLFSPLGAQNEVNDVAFREITCRKIMVVGSDGKVHVVMSAGKDGGLVGVFDNDGDPRAGMFADEESGSVNVYGNGNDKIRASVGVTADGNGVVLTCDKNGSFLAAVD